MSYGNELDLFLALSLPPGYGNRSDHPGFAKRRLRLSTMVPSK
jgi:hypothetical protein